MAFKKVCYSVECDTLLILLTNFGEQFDISGRTALVTGGGRGIGLECAKGLIEAGCDVGIFDVIESTADLSALEKEFDVKIKHYM